MLKGVKASYRIRRMRPPSTAWLRGVVGGANPL